MTYKPALKLRALLVWRGRRLLLRMNDAGLQSDTSGDLPPISLGSMAADVFISQLWCRALARIISATELALQFLPMDVSDKSLARPLTELVIVGNYMAGFFSGTEVQHVLVL